MRSQLPIVISLLAVAGACHANPTIFAPGVVSGTANASAPAFTPDGKTVFFTRGTGSHDRILVSHREGSQWTASRVALFSGKWRDLEPSVAPDGSYLIFDSDRPLPGATQPLDGVWAGKTERGLGGNLWRVDKTATGWGKPVRLSDTINRNNSIYDPVVVGNGDLYFLDLSGKQAHLFEAKHRGSAYSTPIPLSFSSSKWSDYTATVAPDESFIIFSSTRPPTPPHHVDLFIACRKGDEWGSPKILPSAINHLSPVEPRLSTDAHTLYFSASSTPRGPEQIWRVDITALVRSNCHDTRRNKESRVAGKNPGNYVSTEGANLR